MRIGSTSLKWMASGLTSRKASPKP